MPNCAPGWNVKKKRPRCPKQGSEASSPLLGWRVKTRYLEAFPPVDAGLLVSFTAFLLCFLTDFLAVLLLDFAIELTAGAVWLATGAAGLAGVCAAKVRVVEATAKAIARIVVFIVFSPGGLFFLSPAYSSILRQMTENSDSLRRL